MPEEYVLKIGDQWEVEIPGFGKMTVSPFRRLTSKCFFEGVFVEHGESFTNCIKIGEKTITIKGKVIRIHFVCNIF